MSGDGRGDYSVLQKIQVTCRTCDVSESFYSNLSVEQFKSKHRGHEVVGGAQQEVPSTVYAVKPTPKKEEPLDTEPRETEARTRLAKVRVDLVVFPVLPDPVFRVRGFKDDLEEAFITNVRFEHAAKVREILAGGEYVDHELGGMRYTWEPEAVEFDGNARERLGLPAENASEVGISPPRQEPQEKTQEADDSTVAKTNEILLGEFPGAEAREATEDPVFPPPSVPPPPTSVRFETPSSPAPGRPAPEQTVERPPVEAPSAAPPEAAKTIVKPVQTVAQDVPIRAAAEEAEAGQLLVSKSWYIQGGTGNRKEAVRVSQVLKAFRWKVEPIYTIGVMLDDMLSIETSRSQISRTLIMRIENAGYRLTAVTTEQGKPVAWFKKAPETSSKPDDVSSKPVDDGPGKEEPRASQPTGTSGEPGLDELDAELEPDVTG